MYEQRTMAEDIAEFGERVAGADYVLRPGGYVVARNRAGEIAIVSTPKGCFLPGGGQEAAETLEQTAAREAYEECGLLVEIIGPLCTADELVLASSKKTYYRKRCTFFSAKVVGLDGGGEDDHELLWMSPDEAATRLTHRSQIWAIAWARS
jgi:8-oxo-dGTP diphosphatase